MKRQQFTIGTLLFSVVLAGLLFSATPVLADCSCYDENGVGSSENSEDECTAACASFGETLQSVGDDGFCTCTTTSASIECTTTCSGAGLSNTDPTATSTSTTSNTAKTITPTLNVDIPGLNVGNFSVTKSVTAGGDSVLDFNFFELYVSAIYVYLIGISILIAIIMIMIGGLQYAFAGGHGDVGKAKERIKNAVIGLVLLLSTYSILYLVNPQLVSLETPTLTNIKFEAIDGEESEDDSVTGTVATSLSTASGSNITGGGVSSIPDELATDIEAAAATMADKGYGIAISSSYRSVEKQKALIAKNCQNPAGSATCNPKPGRPTTCILRNNDPANCPHTTGRALDIWGTKGGAQCLSQDECLADRDACREDDCQGTLIDAMRAEGFCNLRSEPWHFEKPKMSSTCN